MMNKLIRTYYSYILKEYLSIDFKDAIELYAIITYLDEKIKDIEVIDSDILIEKFIKKNNPIISARDLRNLKEYAHDLYLKYLLKYKKDNNHFIIKRKKIIQKLKNKINDEIFNSIILIIKADNEISQKEKQFLLQINYKEHEC